MPERTGSPQREKLQDVGTLWTMRRNELTARCALLAWPGGWEIRVVVEADTLLTARCDSPSEAFELAEQWKIRLADDSWQQIVPHRATAHNSTRPNASSRQHTSPGGRC